MTPLLKKAFDMASKLPQDEQEKFASLWIAEMESEMRWENSFNESRDVLAFLAEEALEDLEKGRTDQADWDKL